MNCHICVTCGHNRCVIPDSPFCLENQVKRLKNELEQVRREGAEVMREASAQMVAMCGVGCAHVRCYACVPDAFEEIRALPLPGEENP